MSVARNPSNLSRRASLTPPSRNNQTKLIAATSSQLLVKRKDILKKNKSTNGISSLLPPEEKGTIKSPSLIFVDLFTSMGMFSACFFCGLFMVLIERKLLRSLGSSSSWLFGLVRAIWRVWSWRSIEMLEEVMEKTKT